jgi:hypothetical protein
MNFSEQEARESSDALRRFLVRAEESRVLEFNEMEGLA